MISIPYLVLGVFIFAIAYGSGVACGMIYLLFKIDRIVDEVKRNKP
jgi:hypothetical protein